jgi:hypothetical protein
MATQSYLTTVLKKHEGIQCTVCNSEGEIDANKVDDIIIDSDGIHRLQ